MGLLRNLAAGIEEHGLYFKSIGSSGAYMVPRWNFFEEIADEIPPGARVILELGVGTGRLMEVVMARRDMLPPDGLYIGVDCNRDSMKFILQRRAHLTADPRVRLVTAFAQDVRPTLDGILRGKKIDVTVVSIPHLYLSKEDIKKMWGTVVDLSSESGRGILYNVSRRRTLMESFWHDVRTYRTAFVHHGLPPEFEVNVGSDPRKRHP